MKKRTFLAAVYFVCLLAVPIMLIISHYSILLTGDIYKFDVTPYDPYDPFRGRYAAINLRDRADTKGSGEYFIIEKDVHGFGRIVERQITKPDEGVYIKNFSIRRYYLNEKLAPRVDRLNWTINPDSDSLYVTVAVKKGRYVISGMYINDVPVEEYVMSKDK